MCLGRPDSSAVDARLGKRLPEHLHRSRHVRLAGAAAALQLGGQTPVGVGVERLEAQVLELPLELPDAQALRERRVDLGRLACDALLLLDGQCAQGAHVVQPVGELDEHDADVLRHREEHLADVLGLLLLVRPGAELGQLGDAVDEVRHLRAEALLDVRDVVLGVLRHVMEQRRLHRERVEADLGQDLGHRERVGDVRLSATRAAVVHGPRARTGTPRPPWPGRRPGTAPAGPPRCAARRRRGRAATRAGRRRAGPRPPGSTGRSGWPVRGWTCDPSVP